MSSDTTVKVTAERVRGYKCFEDCTGHQEVLVDLSGAELNLENVRGFVVADANDGGGRYRISLHTAHKKIIRVKAVSVSGLAALLPAFVPAFGSTTYGLSFWHSVSPSARRRPSMFGKSGIEEQINLQRDGAKAKPYQVRQVRGIISRYDLREI